MNKSAQQFIKRCHAWASTILQRGGLHDIHLLFGNLAHVVRILAFKERAPITALEGVEPSTSGNPPSGHQSTSCIDMEPKLAV